MCKIQGAFNGIKVEVDVPENLPPARADKSKLKQALLNLWKNAIEAMPGGGTLIIKGQTLADRLVIEFHDTGTGIPAGIDIFEPFTTTKKDGTGLGLAVVRQIALAHGGAVTYTSQAAKGTIFRLSLPVHFNL
jgi:signal transduction histidine kinase